MKPRYSIIIPTKNEEGTIAKVICSVPKEVSKVSEIIVADSSTDYTPVIASRLGAKVIRCGKGKGRAMKKAAAGSKGDILVFLDGDGTDPPEYIPKLLKRLEKSNMVLGCRDMKSFKKDDPNMRLIFKIYGVSMRNLFRLAGFKTRGDPLAGFRAIRKSDWERMYIKSDGFTIEAEINLRALDNGFVIKDVPIPHLRRGGGLFNSKLVSDPRLWLEIFRFVANHVRDRKIKTRIEKLRKLYISKKRLLERYFKLLKS